MDTILLTGLFAAFFHNVCVRSPEHKNYQDTQYRRYLRCYVYHVPDRCNLMDSVWHYAI